MSSIVNTIDEFIKKMDNEKELEKLISQINNLNEIFSAYPKVRCYSHISKAAHRYYANLETKNIIVHQKLHLLLLIKKSLKKLESTNFPECIKVRFVNHFQRTVKSIVEDKLAAEFYDYKNNRFLKLQAVCTLNTFPIYPFILDRDKLSLKTLFHGGIGQFFQSSFNFFIKYKGVAPFYKTHTNILDAISMQAFTENGWRSMFFDLSELMRVEKKIKGVCGTSWFIDPIIKDISPELSYINNLLSEIGATIHKHSTDDKTVKDALFFNPKRKKLFESGEYKPRKYLFIITRSKLISWGDSQRLLLNK